MSIDIRLVESIAEYSAVEDLQRAVWHSDLAVTPAPVLITANKNGGLVLGAFDTAAEGAPLVGFVFGFVGLTTEGNVKHCSHMAAVDEAHRDSNVGRRLKLAQREYVLDQGIEQITWTYDPLISRNAYLNIHKLGTTTNTYLHNVYGSIDDEHGAGMPTDRFQVDWWIASERVARCVADENAGPLETQPDDATEVRLLDEPDIVATLATKQPLLVPIPRDIEVMKDEDAAQAQRWQKQLEAFAEQAFTGGYSVIDFVRREEGGAYVLVFEADIV